MHYIYILNCDNAFFYTGITDNLERRLQQHKNGESNFTKRYFSIELVYSEEYSDRKEAENREIQLKGWSHAKKKALIDGEVEQLQRLSQSKS